MEKTIRCTRCRAEFTDAEIADTTTCPTCGDSGVPMEIKNDVQIKINTHELRILCMWADNFATSIDAKDPKSDARGAIDGIVHALAKQLPGVPLTLRMEAQRIADHFGANVQMTKDGETVEFSPKPKN